MEQDMIDYYKPSEIRKDEMFIGNANASAFPGEHLKELKTMRLGKTAYDINGKPMLDEQDKDVKPVFIHKSEYDTYNLIMQARMRSTRRS